MCTLSEPMPPVPPSLFELWETWRLARERSAYSQIVERTYGRVLRVVRARNPDVDMSVVEDCVQTTYVKLYVTPPRLRQDSDGAAWAWLITVTNNNVWKTAKKEQRRLETLRKLHEDPKAQATALHLSVERSADLNAALARLPARERSVLKLYYLEGRTQKAIAEELHCSESTVSRHRRAAVETLRRVLGKEDEDHE